MAAGWMNGFVEIVLGASVVIPIAVGYLGLDWVRENAGFSMAFETMPYLFNKWGTLMGSISGMMWFGLLFFAGITSSLAMGTPWMGFMQDEFGYSVKNSALTFGLVTLVMGLPTVIFFQEGVFDEYDYWAGTVSLVVFALAEAILFGWVFGIDKGWAEIKKGSDLTLPRIYKPILKYVTPTILLVVFVMSLIKPVNNDWQGAWNNGWEFDGGSIIGKVMNVDVVHNRTAIADHFEAEVSGVVEIIEMESLTKVLIHGEGVENALASYDFERGDEVIVGNGQVVKAGDDIANGSFVNPIFYKHLSRLLLLGLFIFIMGMVYYATILRNPNKS